MRRLFAAVILMAALPLAAVDLGPERPAGTTRYDFAPFQREEPRVAVNDDGAVAVWSDARNGEVGVYAARFDRDGKLLDPAGRVVTVRGTALDVIWTGTTWLVVYSEFPLLRMRTMSADGILGAPVTILDTKFFNHGTVRMAANGINVALVTVGGAGRILDRDGRVLSAFSIAPVPAYYEHSIDVAALGDGYGIASAAADGVEFRRLSASGSLSAPQLLPDSDGAATLTLGSDGSSFLAVYDNARNSSSTNLYAQKVDAAGTAVGDRKQVATSGGYPSMEWGGSDYLLAYSPTPSERSGDPLAMHLTRDGGIALPAAPFASTTGNYNHPDAARRGDGSGVAVSVSAAQVVEAGIFDGSTPAPRVVRPLSFSVPAQRGVRMAGQGDTLVTGWVESTATRSELRLARFGGPSVVISSARYVRLIDVVFDRTTVWVVWQESGDGPVPLLARRYTPSLEPIDAAPVTLVQYALQGEFGVAAGGGALMVTWPGDLHIPGVFGRVLTQAGAVVPLTIEAPYNVPITTVAWNGSTFTIVWSQATAFQWWQMPGIVPDDVLAVRVGTDGVLRDAAPLIVSDALNVTHRALSAASADGSVVIAWQALPLVLQQNGPWLASGDLTVTSVARFDGCERPEAREADVWSRRKLLSIAAAGARIALLWSAATSVDYALLGANLTVEDAGSIPVVAESGDTALRGGQPAIAYARVAEELEYGRVHRVYLRVPGVIRRRAAR
jgi:hypothetical protein